MKLSLSELERICEGNSTGFERIFPLEAKETMYFRVRCMPNNPVFRVSLSPLFDGHRIAGIDTSRLDSKTKDETLVEVEQGNLVETTEWRPSIVEKVIIAVIMVFILIVMSAANWFDGYRAGYRQGQIDYHNGKVMYCLSVDDLAQTIWEKCNVTP